MKPSHVWFMHVASTRFDSTLYELVRIMSYHDGSDIPDSIRNHMIWSDVSRTYTIRIASGQVQSNDTPSTFVPLHNTATHLIRWGVAGHTDVVDGVQGDGTHMTGHATTRVERVGVH